MNKKYDLPAMPFYVGDWRKAPDVRALSLEARGLWFEMLCLMWEMPKRGYLSLDGKKPLSDEQLARMIGEDVFVITKLKQVLESCNVYSKDPETGVIFNRRMVKDENIRVSRSTAGALGMKSRYSGEGVCYNKTANKKLTNTESAIAIENEEKDLKILALKDLSSIVKSGEVFVKLSEDGYKKLVKEWGRANVHKYINNLNNHIGSKGVKYANHYYTIKSWMEKDNVKKPVEYDPYAGMSPEEIAFRKKKAREDQERIDGLLKTKGLKDGEPHERVRG